MNQQFKNLPIKYRPVKFRKLKTQAKICKKVKLISYWKKNLM